MTTLFSDNYESGDFAAWTNTYGSIIVQSAVARRGQYACSSAITSTHRTNYSTKTCIAQTIAYMRFYVYFANFASGTWEALIAKLGFNSSRPLVTLYSNNSSVYWRLRDGGGTARTTTYGPATQTWYCVELKAVVDDESALYVNGEKILSGTAPSGSSTSISLQVSSYNGAPDGLDVNFDDLSYSDTYNGPQNLTQTVTDSLSNSESQLCSKQSLTTENISTTEKALYHKSFTLTDQITNQDYTTSSKKLSITEDLSLSEDAHLGIRGHVKTKLYLFLADLAVQLTGD